MFVGEAPGFHEDKQGVPFVGQAGKLLDGLLASVELRREDVYIANVLKCRPPGNRDPQQDEIEACEPHLFRQIELIEPKVIATLGNFATKLLSGRPLGITRVHGQEQELTIAGRSVLLYPIYHPAAALYTPAMLKVLEADFARLPGLLGAAAARRRSRRRARAGARGRRTRRAARALLGDSSHLLPRCVARVWARLESPRLLQVSPVVSLGKDADRAAGQHTGGEVRGLLRARECRRIGGGTRCDRRARAGRKDGRVGIERVRLVAADRRDRCYGPGERVAGVGGRGEDAGNRDGGCGHEESPRTARRRCDGSTGDLGHELLLPLLEPSRREVALRGRSEPDAHCSFTSIRSGTTSTSTSGPLPVASSRSRRRPRASRERTVPIGMSRATAVSS